MDNKESYLNTAYEALAVVEPEDIRERVKACQATGINLLIYSEAGCGKSTIIEGLSDEYNIVTLGGASMCEEMVNGIPVHNKETNSISYSKPEWLVQVERFTKEQPEKPVLIFIDELTLASKEVMNSLQLLLTARAVPTHPNDVLPKSAVIVSATNTSEEALADERLSRPLTTRFMSVRLKNTPETFKKYLLSVADERLIHLKEKLGDKFDTFVNDCIADFAESWLKNDDFYGVNPRTIMNFFKFCDYQCEHTDTFTSNGVRGYAKSTTGVDLKRFNWESNNTDVEVEMPKEEAKAEDIMDLINKATTVEDLCALRNHLTCGTKRRSNKTAKALVAINLRVRELKKNEVK